MTRPKDEMGSQIVSSESDISHPILVYLSRNNNFRAQAWRFPALTAPEPEFAVIFGSKWDPLTSAWRQPRETRWTSDGRLSSPETNLKVGLLPLFFMQRLPSHMFPSFMVRTSPLKGQVPHDEACSADRCARRQFSGDSQLQAAWQTLTASETHVVLFRPSWKRNPFLIFVFRIWSRRMFIWSQWCAWSSGFRRKVATAPSFLVAKPRVPVAKCDYAPGFFEPWNQALPARTDDFLKARG